MKHKRGYYDVFLRTCAKYPSNIAVKHYQDGIYKSYTYSELFGVCEYISQNIQPLHYAKGVIGVLSDRNIIVPSVIAAIHKCCKTFMFMDPSQDIESFNNEIPLKVIISIKFKGSNEFRTLSSKNPDKTITVFDHIINFYHLEPLQNMHSHHMNVYSFIAMTSGSTGEPKHIQVPVKCIQPNVNDLTNLFNITSEDIIYFSTPLTFDPSMIEILLACRNGASLLIAPERVDVLFPEKRENSITFWQTTPSKFCQHTNAEISKKILSANSTLKILALGGEPFNGVKNLTELKHPNNMTRIFTLYGVTEMSCWACVAELDLTKIKSDKEIPLGSCLSETEIVIEPVNDNPNKSTGKIILMSKSRKCVILNKSYSNEDETSVKLIDTGDLGEVRDGVIYYMGRTDDIIKRFGHKINIRHIEATTMQCSQIKTCSCVWLPKPMLLVLYFSSETISSKELSDFIKCKLDDKHWPDKIVRVDNLPINSHGKLSKRLVSKMYDKTALSDVTLNTLKVCFLKELQSTLGKSYTYDEIKNKDFFAIGGTSFLGIAMCNKISATTPQFGKIIMPYLISQSKTIDEIIQIAHKELSIDEKKNCNKKRAQKRSRQSINRSASHVDSTHINRILNKKTSGFILDIQIHWTFEMGKCVDASPTLYRAENRLLMTVGSHSGKLVVVDANSGRLEGSIDILTRIEASVYCCQEEGMQVPYGVVGGYDGTVVCFTLEDCKEVWRANVGAMVKSKVTSFNGLLYVASYDGNIRVMEILTGAVKQIIGVSQHAISANLVKADIIQYILVGTLSGESLAVHATTGEIVWKRVGKSPIFASPVLYDNDKYVVFAQVRGDIQCCSVKKGILIWKYQGAAGHIFSSLDIRKIEKLKWQIIYGCHDSKVYSIVVSNFKPCLLWKTQLPSPVFATPCGLDKFILAVSNNGTLCLIQSDSGILVNEYHLPDEAFSSPTVYDNYVFIGCRNDHVYALKYIFIEN